jgi:hypothetical protein
MKATINSGTILGSTILVGAGCECLVLKNELAADQRDMNVRYRSARNAVLLATIRAITNSWSVDFRLPPKADGTRWRICP